MGKQATWTEEERLDALTEILAQGAYRWLLQQRLQRRAGTRELPGDAASKPSTEERS